MTPWRRLANVHTSCRFSIRARRTTHSRSQRQLALGRANRSALTTSGETLKARLNALGERHGVPVQVTGVGSILCAHFQREPIRQPEDTEHTPAAARALFHLEMLTRGFYTARRGFIALSLPLTSDDHDALVGAFDDFLAANGPALTA